MVDTTGEKIRALLDFSPSPAVLEKARNVGPWLEVNKPGKDPADFADALAVSEVIWHGLKLWGPKEFDQAPNLRLVQKFGVGVDTVDIHAARERGIAVANMPGVNAAAVAEGTIMLVLAAIRALPEQVRRTRAGMWMADLSYLKNVREVGSLVVGLVGYGNIARQVEAILTAMGSTVLHTSTQSDGTESWRSLEDLLKESDVVSLHLPGSPATRDLFDEDAFAKMRKGSIFVNTARGSIVKESALVAALESGHLSAAGLDVYEQEPVDPGNPLLALPQVVVTAHLTWLTEQTNNRMLECAIENCRRLRDGEPLAHRVV